MPQIIETYDEFVERHGGKLIRAEHGRWLLPTGAVITNDGLRPHFTEPPTVPRVLFTLQKEYHRTWLERVETDFNKLKAALLGNQDEFGLPLTYQWDKEAFGPAPDKIDPTTGELDGREALLKLKSIADHHRTELARLDSEYAALPEIKTEHDRETDLRAIEHDRMLRIQASRERIAEINL